jgi:hypothetical protein
MKGMDKISRGAGFLGVLEYSFERDPKDRRAGKPAGFLIGGDMVGHDPRSLAAEFCASRRLRPDIKKPVWHSTLRLPKGDLVSTGQWVKMCDAYMVRMGFKDLHQRCYVLHDDEDGQHVHIIASRIDLNGEIYYGRQENLISTRVIQQLEKDFQLRITKGPDLKPTEKRKLSKKELEKALRMGEKPAKLVIQDVIDQIILSKVTAPNFVSLLEAHGITVKPNIASTGKLSGFSFSRAGHQDKSGKPIFYKGSSLGKSYTAQGLLGRGLQYDPHRDMPILTGHHPQPAPDYSGGPEIRRKNSGREFSLIIFMRYEPASGGGQLYRWQNGAPAFVDRGSSITCVGRATDAKIRGMLDLAMEKGWTRVELSGSRDFQIAAALEAARRGISISGNNTEIQKVWRQEYERTAADRKPQPRSHRLDAGGPPAAPRCGLRGLHELYLVPLGTGAELLLPTDARNGLGIDEQNSRNFDLRREGVIDGIETCSGSATATTPEAPDIAGNRAGETGDPGTPARLDGDKKNSREPKSSGQDVCSSPAGGDFQNDRSWVTDNEKGNRDGLAKNGKKDSERDTRYDPRGLATLDQTHHQPASPDSRSDAEERSLQPVEPKLPLNHYPSPGG